jgi:hypothetical protein
MQMQSCSCAVIAVVGSSSSSSGSGSILSKGRGHMPSADMIGVCRAFQSKSSR